MEVPERSAKTIDFIRKAKIQHGDKYDYSLVVYIKSFLPVKIICKTHGKFDQKPATHLSNHGCRSCGNSRTKIDPIELKKINKELLEKFKIDARKIHGDKYDYGFTVYHRTDLTTFVCPTHGEYEQSLRAHLNRGCTECHVWDIPHIQEKLLREFKEKATIIHKGIYDYSNSVYNGAEGKIKIICRIHGEFEQFISNHIRGADCKPCSVLRSADQLRKDPKEAIKEAKEIHGDKYDYSKMEYHNYLTKVTIICPNHGDFGISMAKHIHRKQGCRKCSGGRYSEVSIGWLESRAKHYDVKIQHSGNDEEFLIPGTRYHVDGYNRELNKVFEFHGDYWHGNPELYDSDDCNAINGKTFGELYQKTLNRKKKILELGYNYEEIWESEWLKSKKNII